jgi:hypothetical protein
VRAGENPYTISFVINSRMTVRDMVQILFYVRATTVQSLLSHHLGNSVLSYINFSATTEPT